MELSNKSKPKVLAPEGMHNARCIRLIDLGTQLTGFNDKETGEPQSARQLQVGMELVDESYIFNEEKGEQNFTMYRDFTMSLSEKANLTKMITSWTGTKFIKGKENKFDLSTLLNAPCQIQILHKVAKTSGNPYAIINSIVAPPKNVKVAKAENDIVSLFLTEDEFDQQVFDKLPDWLREKIAKSPEYLALFTEQEEEEEEEETSTPVRSKGKKPAAPVKGSKGKKPLPPAKGKRGSKSDDLPF